MKRLILLYLTVALLLLAGCQHAKQPDPDVGTNIDGSQGPAEPNKEETPATIPIMRCDLDTQNISLGNWDLATNTFSTGDILAGTTSDPYSLYALHWDGERIITGLQVYLEEINKFDDSFDLRPAALEEVIKDGISITLTDNGELTLSNEGQTDSISGAEVNIDEIGEVSPAMMQGNALAVAGNTVFYLQSVMGESGLYLVCTTVNMDTMSADNYVVGDKPFPYSEVDIDAFGPSLFAEHDDIFYFCMTDAVFSFDPVSHALSRILTLDSLGVSNDTGDYRVQLSGMTVYEGCLIVESTMAEQDIHTQKIAHLCSLDGAVLKSISWDCQEELIIFPKA